MIQPVPTDFVVIATAAQPAPRIRPVLSSPTQPSPQQTKVVRI